MPTMEGIKMMNPKDRFGQAIKVWHGLIETLQQDHHCEGFCYDWRKWGCPKYVKTVVQNFRELVEPLTHDERVVEQGPVSVITHSMGGEVILYCLNELGAEWQKKYIKEIIMIAPAPCGSPVMIPSYSNNTFGATRNALFDILEDLGKRYSGVEAVRPVFDKINKEFGEITKYTDRASGTWP